MEIAAVAEREQLPFRVDRIDGGRLLEPRLAGKGREGVGEEVRDLAEADEVARAAVHRRPGLDLSQHRLAGTALDRRRFVVGKAPHGQALA